MKKIVLFFMFALLLFVSCPQPTNENNNGNNGNVEEPVNTLIDLSTASDEAFTREYFNNYIGLNENNRKSIYNENEKKGFSLGSLISLYPFEYINYNDFNGAGTGPNEFVNHPFFIDETFSDSSYLSGTLPILIRGIDEITFSKESFNGKNQLKVSVFFSEDVGNIYGFNNMLYSDGSYYHETTIKVEDTLKIEDNCHASYSFWKDPYWKDINRIYNPLSGYYFYISEYDKDSLEISDSNFLPIGNYKISDFIESQYKDPLHEVFSTLHEVFVPTGNIFNYLNWTDLVY